MDSTLQQTVLDEIEQHGDRLIGLSLAIHGEPEIAYDEYRATARCRELLTDTGFDVTSVPEMDTAFVAERRAGDGPCVAMLAEYDALPELGHGCGHNLIAGAAIGAGIGLASVLERLGGTIRVYGCPAEEGGAGKVRMLEQGAFDGVDAAITFHAWTATGVMVASTGQRRYDFKFRGRASHVATDPWHGASALEAVVLLIGYVNALRQHVRDGVRLHGIVTDGGAAVNIVPDHAAVRLGIRSEDLDELGRVDARVQDCARAAALAAGVSVDIEPVMTYEPVRYEPAMGDWALARLRDIGRKETELWRASASTDFGNVTQVVPGVLVAVKTWPDGVAFHTAEAALASAQPMAQEAMLDGARTMALVGADVLSAGATDDDKNG